MTPFEKYGKLAVRGTELVDASGRPAHLYGISSHGLNWYPEYVNEETLRYLRDEWQIDIFRLALYTEEENGYCVSGEEQRAHLEKVVDEGVRIASQLGLYIILDWHILQDGSPKIHEEEALQFFRRVSAAYGAQDNVLYEICNEPNPAHGEVSWSEVREYEEKIIPVIRRNAPDAVIIAGTPTWSQDVHLAAAEPLSFSHNIMYTLHFYAGTHGAELRDRVRRVRRAGLPVFISEFSIVDASGDGPVDEESALKWKRLIEEENLSCLMWSLSNRDETSAFLKPSCGKLSGWEDEDLNDAAKWMREFIRENL